MRIAGALEDLAAQESVALGARDFSAAQAVQERAAPLVEFLAANAAALAGDSVLRTRIAAVQMLRARSAARLEAEVTCARVELGEARFAQRQVAKIAPAYGRGVSGRSRLSVVG